MFSDRYNFKRGYKRLAVYIFDTAGRLFFRQRKSPMETDPLRRVLFIRMDQIGDIAMIVPAVKAFKAAFPNVALDLLTSPEGAQLFSKESCFEDILIFENPWFKTSAPGNRIRDFFKWSTELRKKNYDAAVDFRGDLRTILLMSRARIPERIGYPRTGGQFLLSRVGLFQPDLHQVKLNLALLSCFGITSDEEPLLPPFQVSEEEKKCFWEGAGAGLLLQKQPLLVVHPGAGRPEKIWEKAKFRRLVERMLKDNLGRVVLIGTETEKQAFGEIKQEHAHLTDLRGKTRLRDLLVLFSAADIFIGNDSGPAHLAAAQGARIISIFKGPNDPQVWHPWTKKLTLVQTPKPCPVCGELKRCRGRKKECNETIPARRVYEAVLEAWRSTLLSYPFMPVVQPSLEEF